MSGTVFIVHCVDTEGPLFEEENAPFELVKRIFGIDIPATEENLIKLQLGKMGLGAELDKAIMELLDPHRMATGKTWEDIERQMEIITSEKYRLCLPDSDGNGWVYSWFCMDHVGFTGKNPRRRDAGYHKIFDRYNEMVNKQQMGDTIQFHYHPVSISGNYNDSGTAYWGSNNLNQILCRKIIERKWFPTAFRPGFHTERPDSNWFLEQWIPFDYGNQSMKRRQSVRQDDLDDGRFGDWRHAPLEWIPYHPSHDDYQKKGNCRRYITRCLNMYARIRQIEQEDVDDAFFSASEGNDIILSFTNHDYKDMVFEIDRTRMLIEKAKNKYKNVRYVYTDAVSAMRQVLNLKEETIKLDATIIKEKRRLTVKSNHSIFGPQPFLALKSKLGNYYWDNFDFSGDKEWSYTFDNNTLNIEDIDSIGVAGSNSYGSVDIVVKKMEDEVL